jgi:hypothetical protein
MRNYFAFEAILPSINDKIKIKFLFKAPGKFREGDLSDAIEESVKLVLFPDVIAVICSPEEIDSIETGFKSSSLIQAANRTSNKISLCLCLANRNGKITFEKNLRNPVEGIETIINDNSDSIVQFGLKELFSAPHISVRPPPGFAFVKPSGDRSTQFLRTEEALTETEYVQFVSFALLERIHLREETLKRPIEVIYIDTMGISSVAYTIRERYCALYDHEMPRIESFHSHGGLEDLNIPQTGTSFCIISASQSMRLERLWRETTRCQPCEVVTLLTLDTANSSSDALYALHALTPPENNIANLKDLRIAGERFVPEEIKPKKILLRQPKHKVPTANFFAKYFSASDCLRIQARGPNPTGKVRPIYLKPNQILKNKDFKIYLSKILQQKVAISLQAVVYQNDEASKSLAKYCVSQLNKISGVSRNISLMSEFELNANSVTQAGALLIVAAVVGRGSRLLSISRDLRSLHIGARTYIIGAQIAEAEEQIKSLSRNLEYSATKAQILIERFASVATGKGIQLSYAREHDFYQRIGANEPKHSLHPWWKHALGTIEGSNEFSLFPTGKKLDQPLRLRPDFAYWNFPYKEHAIHTPAVMMTISAILQNAREAEFLTPENRLATDAFQQVVLDPENFARYNDGVIQAALLKAALPGELDYTSDNEASLYVLELVTKIVLQYDKPQGEAALEFALALRTGKLKITTAHREQLGAKVKESITENSPIAQLLRKLLIDDSGWENEQFPSNF